MACKRNCYNCKYCKCIREEIDKETGEVKWFETFPGCKDNDGNDFSPNAHICVKFSNYGDKIFEEGLYQEDVCDDFEEGLNF